jgi:formylmethanofuran dehydrogenase subunit E
METNEATFDKLLEECERLHGHICPGQLLGVRMALLGCDLIGVEEPKGKDRKKLIVWVEIDRCMTDAVSAVTGARLGRRSLKFVDYGKVAATFLNTETGKAVRIVARDDSRELAEARFPQIDSKKERQLLAYRQASDSELFNTQTVKVNYSEMDMPGRPRSRVTCERCGESINDGREHKGQDEENLCVVCLSGGYYETEDSPPLVRV